MCSGGIQPIAWPYPIRSRRARWGRTADAKIGWPGLQYGFLLGLKLDHPGLTEAQAVRLNFQSDIQASDGKYFLILWPIVRDGNCTSEPMTERSVERLRKLWASKQNAGLTKPISFTASKRAIFLG